MSKIFLAFLLLVPFVSYASTAGDGGKSVVIQDAPCKGVPESQKIDIRTPDGQSIELECHHFLIQQ